MRTSVQHLIDQAFKFEGVASTAGKHTKPVLVKHTNMLKDRIKAETGLDFEEAVIKHSPKPPVKKRPVVAVDQEELDARHAMTGE